MKTQKTQKNTNTAPKNLLSPTTIVIMVSLFLFGFALAYFVFKPKQHKIKLETKPTNMYPMLNPLLDEFKAEGLNMTELKSFKEKIESYIAKEIAISPGLHVSYYFRDLNNGLWTGINEREGFAPASLMKIPVMMAILKRAETDPEVFNLEMVYDSVNNSLIEEDQGFKKVHGQHYSMDDLIKMMIDYSDNFATLTLLKFIGEEAVQKVETDLNIRIKPEYTELSNFVTVKNYASFFRILYNSSYLNQEMSQRALAYLSKAEYNEGIRKAVPDTIMVAHKYGKRDLHKPGDKLESIQLHHFGLVYYPGKPYILGVMTRGSDLKQKQKIIYELSKITFEEVDKQTRSSSYDRVFHE
jgi:beta-lactamase class A